MSERPHLHQNSQTLSLSLDSSLIQSCMRLAAPDELILDYTRTMMGFLLLNPAPSSVLMIGLGGGSMLKYLHKHLPDTDFTTVEINQDVIDMRDAFCIPPDSERMRIVCADGARFMAKSPQLYDVILVDGFSGAGLPDALCSRSFYQHCRAALTPDGVLVANVQADTQQTRDIALRLRKAFSSCVVTVESDEGGNEIMTASSANQLKRCAAEFDTRWSATSPIHQTTLAVSSLRLQRALKKIPITP